MSNAGDLLPGLLMIAVVTVAIVLVAIRYARQEARAQHEEGGASVSSKAA